MDADALFALDPPAPAHSAPAAGQGRADFTEPGPDAPLAVRMRPANLDELVGQEHLLAPGAPLRQLVDGAAMVSTILWGPPGTGKTTIAHLVGARRRPAVRGAVGALGRSQGRPCGDRHGPPGAARWRAAHGAVHRRGAPVLQDPAGLATRPRSRTGRSRCWRPPRRTRTFRSSRRCCPGAYCSPSSRSTTPRCVTSSAAPWSTSVAWPARCSYARRPRSTWSGSPAGTSARR